MPDAAGSGYWVITQSGYVYAFGDAPYEGAPGPRGTPVTSAVRTADGRGYWILLADGADGATAIFADADGGGYCVASADGAVFTYGDAPADGSMAGTHLNGSIIAATGF